MTARSRCYVESPGRPLGGFAGPVLFVPESHPLDTLLAGLRRERASLAVVLDGCGELAGVVSVEDILEEIVGEIHDERDPKPDLVAPDDGALLDRGHVSLDDLADSGVVGRRAQSRGGMREVDGGQPDAPLPSLRSRGRSVLAVDRLPGAIGVTGWSPAERGPGHWPPPVGLQPGSGGDLDAGRDSAVAPRSVV